MPEIYELKLRYIMKQKHHKQKTTKKPWPLPSGTTPFLKKERIKLKSEEKEGCQTPQIPVPWNNPMLDVVNSAMAPSTNKNWRYIYAYYYRKIDTQYKSFPPYNKGNMLIKSNALMRSNLPF